MKTTLRLIVWTLKIAALAVPAVFEYYSSRSMGVYRYLVAFNYRQQQWPLTADVLNWLSTAGMVLGIVFTVQLLRRRQRPLAWRGLLGVLIMLVLARLAQTQAMYSCYLFLYGWLIVMLISAVEWWFINRSSVS